jgi:drug/metabolite transporter (DMT)-like permease
MAGGPSITIGLISSLAAALLLSTGLVLQALDARCVADHHGLRLSLLGRLLRRPRWLAGTAIGYLAFPFQLLALRHAPLVLVQPVHAFGLLIVLAAGARLMRERVGTFELLGVAAIVTGLGLVAWGSPAGVDSATSQAALGGVTLALTAFAFMPFGLGERCGRSTLLVCSGLGFAAANMAVKGFSDQLSAGRYGFAAAYLALAGIGSTAAILSQMTAFQRHRAVEVVPITYAVPNFLPVLLAAFVLHERWATAALAGAPFALGGALLLVGTAAVARAGAVTRLARQAAG